MGGGAAGYTAFLSYSHRDAAAARKLHRRLEAYRIPRRLVGSEGARGPVPARLAPIFRDREELPAAGDLTQEVRAALAASRALVVVCSPHSAASPWVGREITAFRELHPDRPILAAIIDGEPGECFPPDLTGGPGGARIEPLAADLRAQGDGERLGLLKLVAGLAGVPLDALVQRDAQRRIRRVTAVTAAALAAMLVMAVMTTLALTARAEAQRQRAEAEGLVEFMLTDLRDRLKGVGRLDVLTAVNARALDYYEEQDLEELSSNSLERRARILHAMGEDDMNRGKHARALAQFREAARTTAALLAANPDDPDRIFAQSQSDFWIGYVDFEAGRYAAAKPAFERYKALLDRLIAINPKRADWMKEAGFADGSLCSIALSPPVNKAVALQTCTSALERMETAARLGTGTQTLETEIANRHAWLADAYLETGDVGRALSHRHRQKQLLDAAAISDPRNVSLREKLLTAELAIAGLELRLGNGTAARLRLSRALQHADSLVSSDPQNATWRQRRSDVTKKISELNAMMNRSAI